MDKKKFGIWQNIGFPPIIANILKFLMLELKNYRPKLYGDCVRRLFSDSEFDNCVINIYLEMAPKKKDERIQCLEHTLQKMNCFFEQVIMESTEDSSNFIVINNDNTYHFNLTVIQPDTIFDVNNLAIDHMGSLSLINNSSYSYKYKVKEKSIYSHMPCSVIEAINHCKHKQVGYVWFVKKIKVSNLINILNEMVEMMDWTVDETSSQHITWSVGNSAIDCPICQDDEIEKNYVKLGCGHKIHIDCFIKMLSSENLQKKCPLDKIDLSPFEWPIEIYNRIQKKMPILETVMEEVD